MKDNYFWCFRNIGLHSCFLLGFAKGTVNFVVPGQCVLLKKTLETVLLREEAFGDQTESTSTWGPVYIRTLKELRKCNSLCFSPSPRDASAASCSLDIVHLAKEVLPSHWVIEIDPNVHLISNLWISSLTFLVCFRIIPTMQFPLTKSGSCFKLFISSEKWSGDWKMTVSLYLGVAHNKDSRTERIRSHAHRRHPQPARLPALQTINLKRKTSTDCQHLT